MELDAHHITNRNEMPKGGYVAENGISVCDDCHLKAEQFWSTGIAVEGFSPEELYTKIGSSYDEAVAASDPDAVDEDWLLNVECSKCGRVYCDCESKY